MPATNRELLLKILASARGKPLSVEDVLMRGAIDVGAKPHVRREMRSLVKEGLAEAEGKRYRLPRPAPEPEPQLTRHPAARPAAAGPMLPPRPEPDSREVIGTLTRKREGYGFIAPLHGGDDLFVPPTAMGDALDGDLVKAIRGRGYDGRPVARAMSIVERRRQYAVGTYRAPSSEQAQVAYVEPRDEALGSMIIVPASREVHNGDVVRVALDDFREGEVHGHVVSRLGQPGDPNVEVLSVAYAEGFADVFPPDALRAAQDVPEQVRPEDKAGRRDLTELQLVTIDGEDARDFDDAVFVERTPKGYRLVVAIADVTAYVNKSSALDREALRRATSVYFPRHVLPMLPERLSNGICSLNPRVERLCMVADMSFDTSGMPLDAELYPAVMNSHARCTYTKVAALLAGESVPDLEHVKPMLMVAAKLAAKLTGMRLRRGAIDFDLPEAQILLDAEGEVTGIQKRPRNVAHRLIEEFMLAANEAVARYFESRGLPTVYRVHGEPKEEKLEAFVALAQAYGYTISLDDAGKITAADLNEFLHRIEGRPEQRALNHLLLRSMMQAIYSAENIGHFGLAAPSYLHFTSPIRRYPDLIVHRLLKEHWERGGRIPPEHVRGEQAAELDVMAAHCSERERAATDAEREIDSFYAASFMQRHIGERFAGTVSSVAEFGLFVELNDPSVDGLIPAETLGEAEFDQEMHRLVLHGGRKMFSVGDEVEVQVENANPLTRRIEFRLIEKGEIVEKAPVLQRPPRHAPRREGHPHPKPHVEAREGKGGPRRGGPRKAGPERGGERKSEHRKGGPRKEGHRGEGPRKVGGHRKGPRSEGSRTRGERRPRR